MTIVYNDGSVLKGVTAGIIGDALCVDGIYYVPMSDIAEIKEDSENE